MTSLFRNDEKEEAVEAFRKQMVMLESVMEIIATIDHVMVVTIVKVVAVVVVATEATEAVILNSK